MFAAPLVGSSALILLLARVPQLAGRGWTTTLVLAVVGLGTAIGLERSLRHLLPLAALLRLTMLFPDRAPSRFKISRGAGRASAAGPDGTPGSASAAAENAVSLLAALGAHDRRTRGHSERVRVFCDMLAVELRLEEDDRDRLRWAALLHDLGKVSVHTSILNKPARLSPAEFATMKQHPQTGAQLAAPLLPWLGEWGHGILHHHEKYDGTGYPAGLVGREISRAGRIISVVDAFETMTAARSYKKPMATKAAREELARCAGSHFDPAYVRAFLAISLPRLFWAMGPLTSLVQLPFLQQISQAGMRVTAAGQTATAVAGAAALATAAVGGTAPAPQFHSHSHAQPNGHTHELAHAAAQVGPVARAAVRPQVQVPAPPTHDAVPPAARPASPAVGPTAPPPTPAVGPTVPAQPAAPAAAPIVGPTVPVAPAASPVVGPTVPPVPVQGPTVPASPPPAPAPAPTPIASPVTSPVPSPVPSPLPTDSAPPVTVVVPPLTPPPPITVVVPPTPPTVTIVSGPTVGTTWTTGPVTLSLVSDTPSATFECSTDGASYTPCSSSPSFPLPNGPAQVWVRAVDPATGPGPSVTTGLFTVAQPPPQVLVTNTPPAATTATTVSFDVASNDPAATLTCQLDGAAPTPCSGTQTYTGLALGSHTVTVVADNPLTGSTSSSFSFMTIAPATTFVTAPIGPTFSSSEKFGIADVPGATYECQVDGGAWSACQNPMSLKLPVGSHTVGMRAVLSGVALPAAVTTYDVVDDTTTFTSTPPASTPAKTATLAFTGAPGVTFECALNGGGWAPCTSPMTYSGLTKGTQTFHVRAVDSTGATGNPQVYSWQVT